MQKSCMVKIYMRDYEQIEDMDAVLEMDGRCQGSFRCIGLQQDNLRAVDDLYVRSSLSTSVTSTMS